MLVNLFWPLNILSYKLFIIYVYLCLIIYLFIIIITHTCYGYEIRLAHFYDVISCDWLCVWGIGVDHQGAYAAPSRQHIPPTHWNTDDINFVA